MNFFHSSNQSSQFYHTYLISFIAFIDPLLCRCSLYLVFSTNVNHLTLVTFIYGMQGSRAYVVFLGWRLKIEHLVRHFSLLFMNS